MWKEETELQFSKTAIQELFIPHFNHLFVILPSLEQEIVDNFLWSNKVKIKRNVAIKQYSDGVSKMLNLVAFIKALN